MAYTGEEILEVLKLTDYYPSKLSYSRAMTIRADEIGGEKSEYGLKLVGHLLRYDHKELETIASQINEANSSSTDATTENAASEKFSYLKNRKPARKTKLLHPMDVMNVLLGCCDEILRQILIEKLAYAKASVPIVLPSVKTNGTKPRILNWSLRSLVLESSNANIEQKYLIHVPYPIVSVIRIGNLHRSKSRLLSEIMNKNVSAAFYHRDCPNASAKRVLSNGCIEAAWFQSSENSDVEFQLSCFAILNLRGDANEFPMHTKLMCESSSLVIIMVDSVDSLTSWHDKVQDEICWEGTKVILAIVSERLNDYDFDLAEFTQKCSFIEQLVDITIDCNDDKLMTSLEWKIEMRKAFGKFMKEYQKQKEVSLEDFFSKAKSLEFQLEDDSPAFSNSKPVADEFLSYLRNERQTPMLPLQGEPFRIMAELEKKIFRDHSEKNESTEDFVESLRKQIADQRMKQLGTICEFTEAEQKFYKTMSSLKGIDLFIALMIVKLGLDGCHGCTDQTIGLENIVCEIGQLYEAVQSICEPPELRPVTDLPASLMEPLQMQDLALRAAELLLLGQPLEILNGHASYIPIIWIKEVFRRVAELTGDKKVFVLSVIGVQSSGKSTLLNALFGLHFPTSAGRCTSGLYCHLLPIEKTTLSAECDYVMILDAEGFRAPEYIDTLIERDNELATFIVGVSDLTVINIEGEIWNDVKDILQIVVYALLRIKQTKNKIEFMPSCVFVHQKISAVDIREKTKKGKAIILKYIDGMVEASAQREGYRNITAFSDVVAYNDELDSYFLPNMWLGNPPLATISSDYCRAVSILKCDLVRRIEQRKNCLNFSDLFLRIGDLWHAILMEDFVFNFTDTKHALAYQSLSSAFREIEWNFRNSNHKMMTIITNKIMSLEIHDDLTRKRDIFHAELESKFEQKYIEADKALKKTLASELHKNTAEIFRDDFEKNLKDLKEEEKNKAKETLNRIFNLQEKKLENYSFILHERIFELHFQILNTESDSGDKTKFISKMFDMIFSEEKKFYEDSVNNAKQTINSAIKKYLPKDALNKYNTLEIDTPVFDFDSITSLLEVTENDIVAKALKTTKQAYAILPTAVANEMCIETFNKCKLYLETLNGLGFEESQVQLVFQVVADFFGQQLANSSEKEIGKETESADADNTQRQNPNQQSGSHRSSPGSNFTEDFIAKYFATIGRYTYARLIMFEHDFIEKTDAYMHLKSRIENYYSLPNRDPEYMLATYILERIEHTVFRCFSLTVSKLLEEHEKCFMSKRAFMAKLFTDLAYKKDFSKYIKVLTEFNDFCEAELGSYLQTLLNDDNISSRITTCFDTDMKVLIKKVQDDLVSSFAECNKTYLEDLLYNFQRKLDGKIVFCPEIVMDYFYECEEGGTKFGDLYDMVKKLMNNLNILYTKTDKSEKINSYFKTNGVKIIFKKILSGCCEKCPFCSAPCLEQSKNHLPHIKHHSLHYPVGVRGTVVHAIGWLHQTTSKDTKHRLVIDCCPALIHSKKSFRSDETDQKFTKKFNRLRNWLGVNSIKYKNYRKEFPDWKIPLMSEMKPNDNDYWKWLMAKFGKEFAEKYKVSCPKIKDEWHRIERDDAVRSICAQLRDEN